VQAACTGDGKTLLAISKSNASVWDTQSFRQWKSFPSPRPQTNDSGTPSAIAISEDGSRIAWNDLSESTPNRRPGNIRVFDSASGEETFSHTVSESDRIHSLDFLSGGQRLLVRYDISQDDPTSGTRELWDIAGEKMLAEFARGARVIVSPDRSLIAVGEIGQSTEIKIHDGASGELRHRTEQRGMLQSLAFRPDSQQLLIASQTRQPNDSVGRIVPWEFASSKITFEQTREEFPFASAMYDAEGQRIFATIAKPGPMEDDIDYYLIGWNAKGSSPIRTMAGIFSTNQVDRLFFVPRSNHLLVLRKTCSVLDVTTGVADSPLPRYRFAQDHVRFQQDALAIDSGGRYSALRLTDLATGTSSRSPSIGQTDEWVQDGETRFSSRHPSLTLFDTASGERYWNLIMEASHYAAHDTRMT